MKIKIITKVIWAISIILWYMGTISAIPCTTGTTTRIWDVLSITDSVLLSVESNIGQIASTIATDFTATLTSITAINEQYSQAIITAETVLSSIDQSISILSTTDVLMSTISTTIDHIEQDIAIIQTNDFGGTFSVINAININATTQFSTLSASLHSINVILNVISGSQLENFLAVTESIASISDVVLINLELIAEISANVASDFDSNASALDGVLASNATISSKITSVSPVVQQDFAGTWTALAALTTLVASLDVSTSILETLFLPTDMSVINIQLETINSAIDVIDGQITTAQSSLATIGSIMSPLLIHLDTIDSSVDVLLQLQNTINVSTSSLVASVATIDSLCDVTMRLESQTSSVISQLIRDSLTLNSNYSTLTSDVDIFNATISVIGTLAQSLNQSLSSDLATILSVEHTIESVLGVLSTISSSLDSFGSLQSHIGVLESDIENNVRIATTIQSKTNVLYTKELTMVSALETSMSTLSTISTQINTLTSNINVLNTAVNSLESTIINTALVTGTITSKTVVLESTVGALDVTVQGIQQNVTTITSNLTILNTDFQQTWTIINAIQRIADSSNSMLITTQSALSILVTPTVDMSGTFTALALTQMVANSIQSTLSSIHPVTPSFIGTYTVLAQMTSLSSDMMNNLGSLQSEILNYNFQICIGNAITSANVGTTGYTITTGGNYFLASTINFSPVTALNAITINADNVVLDLAGKSLIQANSTAGVNGISINPSVTNVTIKNGIIANMTVDNIKTGTGNSNIVIESVQLSGAGNYGIDMTATASTVNIIEVLATNCGYAAIVLGTGSDILISNCTIGGNNGDGLSMAPGSEVLNRVTIRDCEFHGNGGNGIGIYGTTGLQDEIVIDNCSIIQNSLSGIVAAGFTRSVIKNSVSWKNSNNGLSLIGAVSAVEVSDSIFHQNGGVGIYVQNSTAQPCSFLRNIISLNTSNNYLEAVNAGPHVLLGNFALHATEANNYTISGGAKSTTVNKSIIGQTTGTFSTYPGRWINISETTT